MNHLSCTGRGWDAGARQETGDGSRRWGPSQFCVSLAGRMREGPQMQAGATPSGLVFCPEGSGGTFEGSRPLWLPYACGSNGGLGAGRRRGPRGLASVPLSL